MQIIFLFPLETQLKPVLVGVYCLVNNIAVYDETIKSSPRLFVLLRVVLCFQRPSFRFYCSRVCDRQSMIFDHVTWGRLAPVSSDFFLYF